MKAGELVNEYFAWTLIIANKIKANGEGKGDVAVVEKILRSMTPKFDYVMCSIEESKDTDTLTIDELQSSLLVHEQQSIMCDLELGDREEEIVVVDDNEEGSESDLEADIEVEEENFSSDSLTEENSPSSNEGRQ
ncbi:hypothetical protein F0562_017573 [Nyssa sinensis]|uniref:Retrovirus-related Pol polyprotein from transposon TNT 1-94 n=1 Tax=Nyssa sinensis TaxID=561372 RepID=A0A5J4ZFI6_9ASTE|nr:hypothetical protein F0562_017573 [Nyssa sinensis]